MSQKEFNRDIGEYLEHRKLSEDKPKNFEKIKKQAPDQTVAEAHPELEEGKVQVISKEEPWLRRIVESVKSRTKEKPKEEVEPKTEEDREFEAEEAKLEHDLGRSYWRRFVDWLKTEKVASGEEFAEAMEKVEEKEQELKREESTIEEQEREVQKERSRLIWDFVARFRPGRKMSALQEQVFDLEEDLKNMAKITTAVIKQLPPEQIHLYKNSKDFELFKEILRKRNLIKEQTSEQQ
jgi:hypothetical protein